MVTGNKSKEEFRKEYIQNRNRTIDKYNKSKEIYIHLVNVKEFNNAKVVGVYYSTEDEVDTSFVINRLLHNRKIVCFPKVEGDVINFYKINSTSDLNHIGIHGIKEPSGDTFTLVNPMDIDLFIVPGIAFDKELNRLGHGKGYYDKYLALSKGYKIGVCFSSQMTDHLTVDEHDIKMDLVIDEGGIYK